MTDRIHSITLVLGKDMRIDDAEQLISACRQFRGVIEVVPNVSDLDVCIAESRVRCRVVGELSELSRRLLTEK